MFEQLQELFVNLSGTSEKYADPSGVLNRFVDQEGVDVKIGDERDISEVMVMFLERIEEIVDILGKDKNNQNIGIDPSSFQIPDEGGILE